MMRLCWTVMGLSAVLAHAAGNAAERAVPTAVDSQRDPRLLVRVEIRSRGIPVSRTLAELQRVTGIDLSVTGRAGDERAVVFERGAPVATVMQHLADLYRLRWTRETREGKYRYRLEKPANWAREEQALRARALQEVFSRMARSLQNPEAAADILARRRQWIPLFPEILPAFSALEADLVRDGFLYLPAARLPEPARARFLEKLTPLLKRADEERTAALLSIREAEIARGIPPEQATADKPPSRPEKSTVTAELLVDRAPRATVGLRTDTDTWYSWLHAGGDDLCDEGEALYADRNPRTPARGEAEAPQADAVADPFSRTMTLRERLPLTEKDWIGALQGMSDVSGLSLYTDCYHYFNHGLPEPPRAGFTLSGAVTPTQALERLCRPVRNSGTQQLPVSSFWWRRGDTALVRSRSWLWEATSVLPAELSERLAASMMRGFHLSPGDLAALAELDGLQVQSLGEMSGQQEFWGRGIRLPARFTLPAREAALTRGVTWEQLSLVDRQLVGSALGVREGEIRPDARARIKTELRNDPGQGAPVLALIVWPMGHRGGRSVNIPLAGYERSPDLRPAGPRVRLLP